MGFKARLAHLEGRGKAASDGAVGELRRSLGWRSEEAQRVLYEWEEGACRRLGASEGLPAERWYEVWGVDDEDEEPGLQ